jgi:helix-turn-helix protein
VADPYEEEVRRLAKTIATVAELAGRSVEALAEKSGLRAEEIRALFDGSQALEITHVLRLAKALGVHPAELFLVAFPRRSPGRLDVRELTAKMRENLGLPVPEPDEADPDDLVK